MHFDSALSVDRDSVVEYSLHNNMEEYCEILCRRGKRQAYPALILVAYESDQLGLVF